MKVYSENELAKIVFDCALKIHKALGPGYWKAPIWNVYFTSF
jgi:hypothetical protein